MTFKVVLLSLTFRDVSSQLWCLEPPSPYNSAFKDIIASQLRCFSLSLTFKDVSSQLWRSEPSFSSIWCSEPHLQLGVQSRYPSQFDVQSHHLFSIWPLESLSFHNLALKAITLSRSDILATFSTFRATFLAFRAVVHSLTFRAVVHTHSNILSHHLFSFSAFKVIFPQPYHSES